MKKTIKLALVLSTIALLAVSCSVQTHSLVGKYTNGKTGEEEFIMMVYDNGSISFSDFDIGDNSYPQNGVKVPKTVAESLGCIQEGALVPWDLATAKINQTYEIKSKFKYGELVSMDLSGYQNNRVERKYVVADLKLEFSMKGDNIECKVTLSNVPEKYGKTGEVTLTKKIK